MTSCSATEHLVSEDHTSHVRLLCHKCSICSEPQLFSLPVERFFNRRVGPPTSAWPQQHVEEDFLALVRHNSATKLEMDRRQLGLVVPRHVALRLKECSAGRRRDRCNTGACETEASVPPIITRTAELGGRLRAATRRGQCDDARTARCLRCAHSRSAREARPNWPDVRVCDAAHPRQRGRATWHDAQIRHTMDPPSKQDGQVPRKEWYRTYQNTRRFPAAHLDPGLLKQAMQFFAESVWRCWTCASPP